MNNSANVVEVTASTFQEYVLHRSHSVPVLVDFWADWCAPCKMLLPVLLKLAEEYGGAFQLAKVDTEAERGLAEQHGIRSLPTLRLYRNGAAVEEILGAQPEAAIRAVLDAHIERASDRLMQQALDIRSQGDTARAVEIMEQAYGDDPDNPRLPLELVRLLLENGQLDRADEVLDKLPLAMAEQPGSKGMRTLIEFSRAVSDAPPTDSLKSSLDTDPTLTQARYQLAARQVLEGDYDGALENLIELLKRDRSFGDGAAQRGLLALFDLLGEGDARVTTYRRRMFALLH